MDGVTGSQGTAPTTLPKIHNAVVKSNQNNTNGQKSNKSQKGTSNPCDL